ncbi:unnamed protein product, partial [Ascophyllum nodosum]
KILVDSPEARLLKLTKRGVIYIEHKRWTAARQSCPRNKLIDLQGQLQFSTATIGLEIEPPIKS